jgi:hypothetical protein
MTGIGSSGVKPTPPRPDANSTPAHQEPFASAEPAPVEHDAPSSVPGPNGTYVGSCLSGTLKVFTLPLAGAAALPPFWRPVGTLVSSQLFALHRQRSLSTQVEPPPARGDQRAAAALTFAPFIPAFAVHGHLMNKAATEPRSGVGRFSAAVAEAFKAVADAMPDAAKRCLPHHPYPANFVAGRGLTQMAAITTGALLGNEYLLAQTGGERQFADTGGQSSAPLMASPFAVAASTFAVPAAMTSQRFAPTLARLGPAGGPAAVATALVAAALATNESVQTGRADNPK